MTFTRLPIWWTLVVVSAQMPSSMQSSPGEKHSGTVIENKNVNINVNVNSQELAEELLKIIESRLNNRTNNITSANSIMMDLKEAVTPLVSPNRRGIPASANQVANQLDKITRRALTRDASSINMLDEEIMARDIVADMMAFLKMILSKDLQPNTPDKKDNISRRFLHQAPTKTSDDNEHEQNEYVNVRIKIRKQDILRAIH